MRKILHSEYTFRQSHEGVAAPTVISGVTHAIKNSSVSPPSYEKVQS